MQESKKDAERSPGIPLAYLQPLDPTTNLSSPLGTKKISLESHSHSLVNQLSRSNGGLSKLEGHLREDIYKANQLLRGEMGQLG